MKAAHQIIQNNKQQLFYFITHALLELAAGSWRLGCLPNDVLGWGLVNQFKMVTLQDEVSVNMNQEEDPFANYYGNIITETYIQL